MKTFTVNELRQLFLDFFEERDHIVLKSASLVPHNDKSLLLINSGMAPLKPYFTGQLAPPKKRAVSCQKCIRTGDIDNIGKTTRHGTFFEMLGNFSFGDYFKSESLAWTWEFLTETIGLDSARLYPSVYQDDDEAFAIWENEIGIAPERISRFGKEDNFWEHGAGPCGPCSEVYFDRGVEYGCGKPDCAPGCDCDRFIEIWNNVFTQFEGDGAGNYTELASKNIDTGMGLERLAVAVQGVSSIFEIDTIKALRVSVCELCGKEYGIDEKYDVSIRIITDHIRSATFMISDGIMPTNEGRGYVLRRIIRRAARHGRLIGITGVFLSSLSAKVIEGSRDGYPELAEKRDFITKVLEQEERRFAITIDQGLDMLKDLETKLKDSGESVLSGELAFKLYDTYGFPLDLTIEILAEKGISVDVAGFNALMKAQKDKARMARKATNYMGADKTVYEALDKDLTSEFVGYDALNAKARIAALVNDTETAEALTDGESGTVITDITPFYAESGGQAGDTGVICTKEGEFVVCSTIKLPGGQIGHIGQVTKGMVRVGDEAELRVNNNTRYDTCKNHSATHLLHKALRVVLGSHVEQAGSYVDKDRLRFDFSHFAAMTEEELREVERIVNDQIARNILVDTKVTTPDEARAMGAMALFGEKYGESVRVVAMGDYSMELCGGTHVDSTGAIGAFKILSESGVAAGVRRIEALTGRGVFSHYDAIDETMKNIALALKTTPSLIEEKLSSLLAENKRLQSENESLKAKMANEALSGADDTIIDIDGVKAQFFHLKDAQMSHLRDLGDRQKKLIGNSSVILILSETEGKVFIMATADEDAQKKGVNAGAIIKAVAPLVGGKGGGRSGMAEGSGNDKSGIESAMKEGESIVRKQIKAEQ